MAGRDYSQPSQSSRAHTYPLRIERLTAGFTRPVVVLSILAALSAWLYWIMFVRMADLYQLYPDPLLNLATLPTQPRFANFRVTLAFIALGSLYWAGWKIVQKVDNRTAWAVVISGAFLFSIVLLPLYPFDAADIFDNIMHARILGIYHSNPFILKPVSYPFDPFLSYVAWSESPSAYGPVWELMGGLTAVLSGNGIVQNVIAFKILPGLFLWGTFLVTALILRRYAPRYALAGVFLLAWNPILQFETFGNGHNDIAMAFWIVLAAWAMYRRRFTLGILSLTMGAMVKYIPALIVPVALAYAVANINGWKPRLRYLVFTGLLSLLLVVASFALFWQGPKTLTIDRRQHLLTSSLGSAVYNILIPKLGTDTAALRVIQVALAITVLFVVIESIRVLRRPSFDAWVHESFWVLVFYLLVTCVWFQQWYTLWPMVLAPLLGPGFPRRLALFFNFAALSKPLVIGPALYDPYTGPRLEQPRNEIFFTLGVLGPTWLYASQGLIRTGFKLRQKRKEQAFVQD